MGRKSAFQKLRGEFLRQGREVAAQARAARQAQAGQTAQVEQPGQGTQAEQDGQAHGGQAQDGLAQAECSGAGLRPQPCPDGAPAEQAQAGQVGQAEQDDVVTYYDDDSVEEYSDSDDSDSIPEYYSSDDENSSSYGRRELRKAEQEDWKKISGVYEAPGKNGKTSNSKASFYRHRRGELEKEEEASRNMRMTSFFKSVGGPAAAPPAAAPPCDNSPCIDRRQGPQIEFRLSVVIETQTMLSYYLEPQTAAARECASALHVSTRRLYKAVSSYFSLLVGHYHQHEKEQGSNSCATNKRVDTGETVMKSEYAYAKRSIKHGGLVLRRWAQTFYGRTMPPMVRKEYRASAEALINCEDFRDLARKVLHSQQGMLNTAAAKSIFLVLIKTVASVVVPISDSTVRRWLKVLGYQHKVIDKGGIYFDGHNRPDVIEYRQEVYLRKLAELEPRMAEFEKRKDATFERAPADGGGVGAADANADILAVLDDDDDGKWVPVTKLIAGREVVVLFQDESTVMSTDLQVRGWVHASGHGTGIKKKKRGQGIMISGYINTRTGVLRMSKEQFDAAVAEGYDGPQDSTEFLEFGKGNWWTGDSQVEQVKKSVLPLVKWLFPADKFEVFVVYDHSTCHSCYAPDALKAERMKASDGGKKKPRPPNMSKLEWSNMPEADTVWALHETTYESNAADGSKVQLKQAMHVGGDGPPKGMKTVLAERGDNLKDSSGKPLLATCQLCFSQSGLYDGKQRGRCCLRRVVSLLPDFVAERPLVEQTLANAGIGCLFLPKFHCELNPIELVWAALKNKIRKRNDCTMPTLRLVLPEEWANIGRSLVRGCRTRVARYNVAYREGLEGALAKYAVQLFTSHRKIPQAIVDELEKMVKEGQLSEHPTNEEKKKIKRLKTSAEENSTQSRVFHPKAVAQRLGNDTKLPTAEEAVQPMKGKRCSSSSSSSSQLLQVIISLFLLLLPFPFLRRLFNVDVSVSRC
jgi:hypothetical protein